MALSMPRPYEHKNGVYYLNVRMPGDLPAAVRGAKVRLPIGDTTVTTTISDKVFCSLRTKDAAVAKARFTLAYGALARQLEARHDGPKALTHKEIVALAGDVYRERSLDFDQHSSFVPDGMAEGQQILEAAIAAFADIVEQEPGSEEAADEATILATAYSMPNGPQILAWHLDQDSDYLGVTMRPDVALNHLFGRQADRVCAEKGLLFDGPSRLRLLQQIGEATRLSPGSSSATAPETTRRASTSNAFLRS